MIILMHFFLVMGDITVTEDNNVVVVFKNSAPFSTCKTKIDNVLIAEASHNCIIMPMYNMT